MKLCPASKSIEALSSAELSFSCTSICKDKFTLLVESKFVILIYLVSCISTAPSELVIVFLVNNN